MSLAGSVALVGGDEFRRECDPLDRALLASLGGGPLPVVIVPTAATNENPFVAGENGMRHFRRLGAMADKLLIDESSRDDLHLAAALLRARMVYFTGGDPLYLLETMRGSRAWEAVLQVHRQGGLVAGSSAGAMVLGEWMWRFDGWEPALGLAPGLAVVPHHASMAERWEAKRLAAGLPPGTTLVGIDEATALVVPSGQVLGAGRVTVYSPAGETRAFSPGQTVQR